VPVFCVQVNDLKDICKSMGLSVAGKKQDLIDRLLENQKSQQSKSGSASSSRAVQSSAAAGRNELSLQEQDDFDVDDAAEMDSDWADSGSEGLYTERVVRSLCAFFMFCTRDAMFVHAKEECCHEILSSYAKLCLCGPFQERKCRESQLLKKIRTCSQFAHAKHFLWCMYLYAVHVSV
jgi:hypothetical protein